MGVGLQMLDQRGLGNAGGGGESGLIDGVKLLRLRTVLHIIKLSPEKFW